MLPEKRLHNQEPSHISATPLLNLVRCPTLTSLCLQADRGREGLPPSSAARQSGPRRRKRTWRQSSTQITPIRRVTQTNPRSCCRLSPNSASLPVHSDLRATWEGFAKGGFLTAPRAAADAGVTSRGHGLSLQIWAYEWVCFPVHAFSM